MIKTLLNLPHVNEALSHCSETVCLHFADLSVTVHSNEAMLLAGIADYYRSYLKTEANTTSSLNLYVIEQNAVGDELDWLEVPREEGKQGRKEGFIDVAGGRWIKKFKTGMAFLQRPDHSVAAGPCASNLAQIVNFINNQFLNHYLREGFTMGHASAFCVNGEATAIAAGSGGGKSTLMLRCLENPERDFLTNDRLLLKNTGPKKTELKKAEQGKGTQTIGLAKLPRVNPGTLLHSDRLRHILSEERQQALRQMPQSELWSLEEKYDVQIEDEYGPDRVVLAANLSRLIMLDWSLDSAEPTQLEAIDLSAQPDVIEGLRKRPGPFYQDKNAEFADLNAIDSVAHYCDELANVDVYRLTGKIDFDRAYELIGSLK